MGDLKIYDSKEISIIVGALIIDSGFADGEFLRIEPVSPDFVDKAGTDGEVTRTKTNDKRAKVTLRLMQSSDKNALLSVLNNIDRKASNGGGVGPFLVKDRQGTSLYAGAKCWISSPPVVSFDKEAKEREWVIMVASLERLDGGN